MRQSRLHRLLPALVVSCCPAVLSLVAQPAKLPPGNGAPEKDAAKTAYAYSLPGPDGKAVPLAAYKGKFLLLVNLARSSSYNEQLPALIRLSELYKAKDVVVIGIPSNDFGAGEPGKPAEVAKAYADAKVNFPVMAPAKLSGADALPVVSFLTKGKSVPPGGAIHWNYTKFVVDKKGAVVARFSPDVAPDSPEMLSTLDQILRGAYKPAKKTGEKAGAAEDGDDDEP